MKLIKASFEILKSQETIFKDIELAARCCYKSEDKITEDSANKMVEMLTKNKHTAMLEHGTVYLKKDRPDPKSEDYHELSYQMHCMHVLFSTLKHTKVLYIDKGIFITTNYRVIVENNLEGWLSDQCEPTEFHEKRVSVKFTCDRKLKSAA